MPRSKTALTPSEYAVLGLVRRRPTYGYDLQRQFAADRGIGRACPIEPAMVYAILKSLAGLELIDGQWDNSQYPPKAVYSATLEGDAAFERWLRHPVGRMREVRFDFLIKLFFALNQDPGLAGDLIEAQLDVCDAYALDVEAGLSAAERGSFDEIVLQSKLTAVLGTKEWLALCRQRLP